MRDPGVMRVAHPRSTTWNTVAAGLREPQFQEQLALYKRREHLELIGAWAPAGARAVLKTDLFEEGFGKDALLDALGATGIRRVGMDISHVVVAAARRRFAGARYVVSDACALP